MKSQTVPTFTKIDSVLNTPGQFCFQVTDDNEIKLGKNNNLNKKRIDEIKDSIQVAFKKIAENLKAYINLDQAYYNTIINKLERFANSNPLKFPGLQVINLTKEHIDFFSKICDRILICEKSDGVRYLMIQFTNGIIFFLGRNLEFYYVELCGKIPKGKSDHVSKSEWDIENFLDGELILDKAEMNFEDEKIPENCVKINDKFYLAKFIIFDAVIICGKSVGHLKFRERLKKLSEFFFLRDIEKKFAMRYNHLMDASIKQGILDFYSNKSGHSSLVTSNLKFKIDLFMKDYFTLDKMETVYSKISKCLPHENDGVIINLDDYPYYSGQASEIYKWKPAHLNTIDFEVTVYCPPNTLRKLYLLNVTESRDKLLPIACLFFSNSEDENKFYNEFLEISITKQAIAECFYNFQNNTEDTINFHLLCDREIITKSGDSAYQGLCHLNNYNFKFLEQERQTKKINLKAYEFGSWQFMRFRKDKPLANSSYTYFSVMKSIMENVKMSDIMTRIEENRAKGNLLHIDPNQPLATVLKNTLNPIQSSPNDQTVFSPNHKINTISYSSTVKLTSSNKKEDLLKQKRKGEDITNNSNNEKTFNKQKSAILKQSDVPTPTTNEPIQIVSKKKEEKPKPNNGKSLNLTNNFLDHEFKKATVEIEVTSVKPQTSNNTKNMFLNDEEDDNLDDSSSDSLLN